MKRRLLAAFRLPGMLHRHRFLLWQLAWRAFAARHAGSYLGWLWTPLSTAVQFALYMVVFSAILQIKVEGLGIDVARRPAVGFGVFLITGLVPFLALNDVVARASRVFRAHANLASVLTTLGRYEMAEQHLDHARSLYPGHPRLAQIADRLHRAEHDAATERDPASLPLLPLWPPRPPAP